MGAGQGPLQAHHAAVLYKAVGGGGVGAELDSSGNPKEASSAADDSSKKDPNDGKVVIKQLILKLKGNGEL